MANYYSTDIKNFYDEEIEGLAGVKKTQQDTINKIHDSQATVLNEQYNKAVKDTNVAYESEYQKNAVQKLINEKQIAERNANLGLMDSGLNRTQQTAVQLSYANQKSKMDLAKQNALDTLSQNLATSLSAIEQSRITSLAELDASIESQAQKNAISRYETNVDANTKIWEKEQDIAYKQWEASLDANTELSKAAISASAKAPTVSYGAGGTQNNNYILQTSGGLLSRDFYGSLSDNKIDVIYNSNGTTTYVDNNSGKKTTIDRDINPFTGTRNSDVDNGAFKNGYQPDNIKGVKLKKVRDNAENKDVTMSVNGNIQSVWYANGVYYIWRGDLNKYQQLSRKQVYDLGV